MTPWKRFFIALTVISTFATLAGCGGSGSIGSSSSSGGSRAAAFVTDAPNGQFSQVLVTIYQIELGNSATGNFQTIFSSTNGTQINVASLSSVADLLSISNIPSGTYDTIRVTMSNQVMVQQAPNGPVTTMTFVSANATTVGANEIQVVFQRSSPVTIASGNTDDVVVDFNLGAAFVAQNQFHCDLEEKDQSQFRILRQHGEVNGTITSLASQSSFILTLDDGTTINVDVLPNAPVVEQRGGNHVTLTTGMKVHVTGTYDSSTNTLTANLVLVTTEGMGFGNTPRVAGIVDTVDTSTLSFTIIPERMDHMRSNDDEQGDITVDTTANTLFVTFIGTGNPVGLFSDVTSGERVIVAGTYDSSTRTLNANIVLIGDDN